MTASKAHTGLRASPRWPRHLILLAGVLVPAWIPFLASSTSPAPADGITIQYAAPVLIDSFDFYSGTEGWSWGSALPIFDAPEFNQISGDPGFLALEAPNNTNTFGYWYSSPISLGTTVSMPGPAEAVAPAAIPGNAYLAMFTVRTSVTDRARVPQLRVRMNTNTNQESVFMAVESMTDGLLSPAPDSEYALAFSLPSGTTSVQLACDLLNFDKNDDPEGDIRLDSAELYRLDPDMLSNKRVEREYTFDNSLESWTPVSSIPPYDSPASMGRSNGALTITGGGSAKTFCFWVAPPNDVIIQTGRVYFATFWVSSTVPAASRSRIPQFRCRLNETSFHSGMVVAVESVGTGSASPASGEIKPYYVFFPVPSEAPLAGRGLMASFDYLNFDPSDDATATLRLLKVTIESAPAPEDVVP